MLATTGFGARPLSRRDRAPAGGAIRRLGWFHKSFKYVVWIGLIHMNVGLDPIALRASRVYLRWCDARPVARVITTLPD
jgi:hypothetical protein